MDAPATSAALRFQRALWLLPAGFALHELEEWHILDWYERYWTGLDPKMLDPRAAHAFLLFAIASYAAWTLVATRFRSARISAHLLLVPFVLILFGHSFFHLGWVVVYRAYAPGALTALLVLPPLAFWFAHRAVREGWMERRVALVLLALGPLLGVAGLRGGNLAPPAGLPPLRVGSWILEWLG